MYPFLFVGFSHLSTLSVYAGVHIQIRSKAFEPRLLAQVAEARHWIGSKTHHSFPPFVTPPAGAKQAHV